MSVSRSCLCFALTIEKKVLYEKVTSNACVCEVRDPKLTVLGIQVQPLLLALTIEKKTLVGLRHVYVCVREVCICVRRSLCEHRDCRSEWCGAESGREAASSAVSE